MGHTCFCRPDVGGEAEGFARSTHGAWKGCAKQRCENTRKDEDEMGEKWALYNELHYEVTTKTWMDDMCHQLCS